MRRQAAALWGAVALAVGTAGCGTTSVTDQPPAATPSSEQPSSEQPSSEQPSRPDRPSETDPPRQSRDPSGGARLVFTDVRVRGDRVVLVFSGRGRPGWGAGYVDRAALEGSGRVVDLQGDVVLDVFASGTTWPAPDYYDGPRRLAAPGAGAVAEVFVGGTFEGYTQVLVGIDGQKVPFRVRALTRPTRLVVDVDD